MVDEETMECERNQPVRVGFGIVFIACVQVLEKFRRGSRVGSVASGSIRTTNSSSHNKQCTLGRWTCSLEECNGRRVEN